MVIGSLALHDFPIDSLAVSIRDVGQGGNLKMHTDTVDMFVFGVSKGWVCEGVLRQILVVLAAEGEMPTVRQSDSNVVVEEKRSQRHDPSRSKPGNKNCVILQKVKAQATFHLGVLERVHHQFAGFRVPIEGVTKFLDLGETTLCWRMEWEGGRWLCHNVQKEIHSHQCRRCTP